MTEQPKTYRDYGWKDPKFKYGEKVVLVHQPEDEHNDTRIFTIMNYCRCFNGDFLYLIQAIDESRDIGEQEEGTIEAFNETLEGISPKRDADDRMD